MHNTAYLQNSRTLPYEGIVVAVQIAIKPHMLEDPCHVPRYCCLYVMQRTLAGFCSCINLCMNVVLPEPNRLLTTKLFFDKSARTSSTVRWNCACPSFLSGAFGSFVIRERRVHVQSHIFHSIVAYTVGHMQYKVSICCICPYRTPLPKKSKFQL